ncbi:phospho-sugar mutase [[Mycoplasma] testudinis]|uniref:phospho-sugar mutase n=1 Tax=[Mycoplasma] testudinis TaxID=33924 RepID=UPI0004860EDB|nr:phospho-sugar mutase [[Mycoplasma] testudinis]
MGKLEFGTAGMRGVLGPQEDQLNINHVQRVTEGYAKYLKKLYPKKKKILIVIGRDNRKESKNFAQACAAMLVKYGISVYYSKAISPTPLVSYLIMHKNAQGGINITASHNPKEYNGIKLYSPGGYQILPEEVNAILKEFEPYENYPKNIEFSHNNKLFKYAENDDKEDLINKYLNGLIRIAGASSDFSNLKVAYSPLHGTGAKFAAKLFEQFKVKVFYDQKAMKEDPEFTYVKNPNPESDLAYERILEIAKKNNTDILIVTDPDADRIGLGVKDKNTGEYIRLNGNETAILTFDYLLKNKELENRYLVHSFVSSTLPATMAKENGVKVYETATGFKWIGELVNRISHKNKKSRMLYAFEESYGSLINQHMAADKDALQGMVILLKMASEYKKAGTNLLEVLDKIYQKYGYVASKSITIDLDPKNPHQLDQIKDRFRNLNMHLGKVVDFCNGINECAPSDMLKIEFNENGRYDWIALRPSGTEAKIKFYLFALEAKPEWAQDRFNWFLREIERTFK